MIDIKRFLKAIGIVNSTDQTKSLEINVSNSATTNTKTTLVSSQTADRTLTLPDSTSTLADINSAQSITNKQVSLSNTTDNKLLVSEATTHKIVDSGITHTLATDVTLTVDEQLILNSLNKEVVINGKALRIPVKTFNPMTPPVGSVGDVLYNTFDTAIYVHNGTTYESVSPPVTSVNGQVGDVVLDTDDISEGSTNLYFTDSRAQAALVSDLSGKANVTLNNLGVTAINDDLIPATTATINLGESLKQFNDTYTVRLLANQAFIKHVVIGTVETLPDGSSNTGSSINSSVDHLGIYTSNDSLFPSKDIRLLTGNVTGSLNSGNLLLRSGSVVSGTKGSLTVDVKSTIVKKSDIEVSSHEVYKNISLTASTTQTITELTTVLADYKSIIVKYSASINGKKRTGTLHVAADASNVGISDNYAESLPTDLFFTAEISGSDILIKQTNTESGTLTLTIDVTRIKE